MPATYGFLSTYPPTRCGLATFNAALATHLAEPGGTGGGVRVPPTVPAGVRVPPAVPAGVVRVLPGGESPSPASEGQAGPRVVHHWHSDVPGGWSGAANALNRFDVAIIQHEYGIYPGEDGDEVLPLLRALHIPAITVLHTVLTTPSARQRTVLERIAALSDAVVTMTDTARQRLTGGYRVDPHKVTVIPHGTAGHSEPREAHPEPHLLTWGLLGPGKGIEWALRALAGLRDLDPLPTYTVAGRTHPKVLEHSGDAYRESLHALATSLGVNDQVRWVDAYLDDDELGRLIRSADVVVLPYDSTEQVTSGVLIEAVGAGVPVVATEFPHAVELLADGPGLLVPHQDPEAMASAVRHLLRAPDVANHRTPITGGPTLRWPAVAHRYASLAARLLASRTPVAAPVAASIPA